MKSKSHKSNFWSRFKRLDIFGHPISLRYKNQHTYKSVVGASVTVVVFIGILTYFGILLIDLINKKNFTITTTLSKGMLDESESKVFLTRDNFDMGIYVYYNGETEI